MLNSFQLNMVKGFEIVQRGPGYCSRYSRPPVPMTASSPFSLLIKRFFVQGAVGPTPRRDSQLVKPDCGLGLGMSIRSCSDQGDTRKIFWGPGKVFHFGSRGGIHKEKACAVHPFLLAWLVSDEGRIIGPTRKIISKLP